MKRTSTAQNDEDVGEDDEKEKDDGEEMALDEVTVDEVTVEVDGDDINDVVVTVMIAAVSETA